MKAPDGVSTETCSVAIIGGGPAGLALAAELKRLGTDNVVVLERDEAAGGAPRHCGHYPFGIREFGRLLKGPDYARMNVAMAVERGVDIRTSTAVTRVLPGGALGLSTPSGLANLQAKRVVICTGVREASRAQRFIGGDRPGGILSTGALQSMVYLKKLRPFSRPVILGSELVSFSAIATCLHLGIRPVAMVEEFDRIVARRVLQPYLSLRGIRHFTGAKRLRILGDQSVEAVEFESVDGSRRRLETDGVIISGRFRPESALLRASHLSVDPGSGGPAIDQYGQCSDPAYYAAGNILRPAETSGWCWREGIATARRVFGDLSGSCSENSASIRLEPADPAIAFIVPQRLTLSGRSNGMDAMQVGLRDPVRGHIVARSAGREIWRSRINSRPVRRLQYPLPENLKNQMSQNLKFSIDPDG